MISLFAHWMIVDVFDGEFQTRYQESVQPEVSARELQTFIKSIFKSRIKHFIVEPGSVNADGDWLYADGKVANIFASEKPSEIVNCEIEIGHAASGIYTGGVIKINLIDPETGEIIQKEWHI